MRRLVASVTVAMVLAAGVRPAYAASTPVVNADTFGIELCPQSICGAAIFTGLLFGQVGTNNHALGTFVVAATHEDLPDAGQAALLTGGIFEIRVGFRRIRGVVAAGTLFNNGDDTFTVSAELLITSGGSGTISYVGLLDHNVFPPTVTGRLSQ